MITEPSDDQFAQHILLSHIVSSKQLEAAEEEQAQLSASGETVALSDVLVKQGVLTEAIRENVEQSMNLTQPKPNKQSVGPFNLIKKLGEGGMGTVFLADDTLVKRKVALKVLPKRYANNADFLSRFKREAKSAGQLNHPNIVAAYTTGEDLGLHYYVMEYCDGEPLDRILKSMKRLTWDTAVNYTLQIARGLKHAHEKHIVHRDIKPGNIFITADGVAKILDMGLSKNIRDSEQSFNTVSGTALGTPHYISPEQAKGEREVDGRTDIYSLGATLYHLVTGATPFQGSTPAMVMMKHLNDKLPNPQDLCDDVPDGIVQVIQKMMAKEPDDRYGNCTELIADLELVAQGRLPVNADVAEDKTSVGMRAVRRTSVDANRKPKATGVRNPVARIKAAPVSQRPAVMPRRFSTTILAAIGGTVAMLALLAFFVFGGKKHESTHVVKPSIPAPTPVQTVVAHKEPVAAQISKATALTVPATTPAPTIAHPLTVAIAPIPAPVVEVKATMTKSGNAILFEEDFKKLNLDKLPIGLSAVLKDKLSIVSVSGHGNVLRVATTKADNNVEPGLKLTLDVQKMRGRTILATVQAYAPYGFRPIGDAAFNRPALESILEGRTAKKLDNADILQPDEREWRQLVRIVKVPDDAQTLQFFVKTLDIEGEIFFDDFKVTIIPDDSISGAPPTPRLTIAPEDIVGREPGMHRKRFNQSDEPHSKADPAPLPDPRPFANMYVSLDISSVCNADVISTASHSAADSFKADINSCWTTMSWLKANPKKDAKDLGLPDDGYIRIPRTMGPSGYFQFIVPPAKNAIMLTPAKGRFPNPATLLIPANQRERYSQLAFLHGGSWGDGRVRALLHYSTGKDQIDWLKIEDWHPLYRLPLTAHETVAVATINTHDKPAEMCAQSMLLDGTRVLESITFTFDPVNAPAAEEVPHDDRFSAGIFAISALPAPKPPEPPTAPKPVPPAVKAAPVIPKQPTVLPKPVIDTAPKPNVGPLPKDGEKQILPAEKHPFSKRP